MSKHILPDLHNWSNYIGYLNFANLVAEIADNTAELFIGLRSTCTRRNVFFIVFHLLVLDLSQITDSQ